MLLPDTSVWVAYLRVGAPEITEELTGALERREVVTCGPVVAELVAGARPPDRQQLLASLSALQWADIDRRAWQSIGLLAAELRDHGQVVPLTDIEIAVASRAANAALWTSDRDFERVAEHLEGLDVHLVG